MKKRTAQNEQTGHRGESYEVYSAKANETEFEASYEYASGNKSSASRKKNKETNS